MNKEFRDWLESEIQYLEDFEHANVVEFRILRKLERVIKKYDELHKPVVIPKFAADWIEANYRKPSSYKFESEKEKMYLSDGDSIHFTIYRLFAELPDISSDFEKRKPVNVWLNIDRNNYYKLADAVRYGYSVEEEIRYNVRVPYTETTYYYRDNGRLKTSWLVWSGIKGKKEFIFTEQEIKELLPNIPKEYWEELK